MIIRTFIFVAVILAHQVFNAQSLKTNYRPLPCNYPSKAYITQLCTGYDSIYHVIDFEKRNEGRNFKSSMQSIKDLIHSINNDSALMHQDVLTNYMQSIVQHIKSRNVILKDKKLKVFTYRSIVPNAANYGNGIILFNLNMLAKLDNEAGLAFILCHEISHELKGHVIDRIAMKYKLSNDPVLKKQYEDYKKQEFNSLKSFEAYVATRLQRLNSRSKKNEVQADSLGLVLYLNAGYDIKYAYETMARLDSIDNNHYTDKINYAGYFNSSAQPFKNSWLEPEEQEETIGGGNLVDVKYPDSLKTHPDCKYRLQKMQELNLTGGAASSVIGGFDTLRTIAELEMLKVYIEDSEISKGFYISLQLYARNTSNLYIKASIVEYLYDVFALKKNHYLSQAVDKPGPKQNSSYNETLYFLDNVSPDACKTIAVEFFTSSFEQPISDPYVAYVYLLIKSIDKTLEKKADLVKEYETGFGKNEYYRLLNSRLLKRNI